MSMPKTRGGEGQIRLRGGGTADMEGQPAKKARILKELRDRNKALRTKATKGEVYEAIKSTEDRLQLLAHRVETMVHAAGIVFDELISNSGLLSPGRFQGQMGVSSQIMKDWRETVIRLVQELEAESLTVAELSAELDKWEEGEGRPPINVSHLTTDRVIKLVQSSKEDQELKAQFMKRVGFTDEGIAKFLIPDPPESDDSKS